MPTVQGLNPQFDAQPGMTAHQLDGALHTISGATPGYVLKAITSSSFGFQQITTSDIGTYTTTEIDTAIEVARLSAVTFANSFTISRGYIVDPTTTRGDIIVRGASGLTRKAVPPAGSMLGSDGTDVANIAPVHSVNDFRLTTESGVPVSTSSRTAQGTIYLTPYVGNNIGLFDGTNWKVFQTAEISLALTATSGKNYDVFAYNNAGTITLELSTAWTNNTTRADAIVQQNGVWCKSGALTRRLVGTIRASAANVTDDAGASRLVGNATNLVFRRIGADDYTSHSYTTGSWRAWNNSSTATKVDMIFCLAGVVAIVSGNWKVTAGTAGFIGPGVDGTAIWGAGGYVGQGPADTIFSAPAAGYHYAQVMEYGAGGMTQSGAMIQGMFQC